MKAEKAVGPLIQALNHKECGWMAALALGKIRSEKALMPLIRALMDDKIKVRRASAWALGKTQSNKAVWPLIKALKDEDEEVRYWAVVALEKIGTPEAMKAVEEYKKEINESSLRNN
ncbi:MAG: hypothetical protein GTO17_06895 [Candidatus Aminicenantes bacterium]|nr:hypothetical protein [Candidatus Aminicenantes bacterium]